MKTSAVTFGLAAIVATVAAQDVNSIASSIPSCQSSCINSIFSKQGCSQGDWKCFCTPKSGSVGPAIWAARGTDQCQASNKIEGGGCSTDDIANTSGDIGRLCSMALVGANLPANGNAAGVSSFIASASADAASQVAAAATAGGNSNLSSVTGTPPGATGGSAASATGGAASSASSKAGAAGVSLNVETGLLAAFGAFVLGVMA